MNPTRNPGLRWEVLGDSVAVLNMDTGCAHSLVDLAAAVWLDADGSLTAPDLVQSVMNRPEVSATEHDVLGTITHLQHLGLLEGGATVGRRRMLKMGVAATAGAAVLTIGLPTPAMAASLQPVPPNTPGFELVADVLETNVIIAFQGFFPAEEDDPLVEYLEIRGTLPDGTVDNDYPALFFYMEDNVNLFEPPAEVQLAGPGGLIEVQADGDPTYNIWNSVTAIKVTFLDESAAVLGTAYYPEAS